MSSAVNYLLSIRDLQTYLYTSLGVIKAVDGVSLAVNKEESVGLVGESGCGKTMTALSIMRLFPSPPGRIIGGKILFKEKNLLELTEEEMRSIRGKDISMVFQDPMTFLNPVMKIGDQIAEVILVHQSKTNEEVRDQVVNILEKLRIPSPSKVADQYPYQLSGGMRQRVLMAIALSSNPSLLIADEPTSALDVTVQLQLLKLIKALTRELKTSLMLITHDMGIVADICDKVNVMYAGKILEYADVFTLYEKPAHPYTTSLLKSILSINEFKETLITIEGTVPSLINPPSGCRFHPRCSQAIAICRNSEPPSIEIERNHLVSCWLYQ